MKNPGIKNKPGITEPYCCEPYNLTACFFASLISASLTTLQPVSLHFSQCKETLLITLCYAGFCLLLITLIQIKDAYTASECFQFKKYNVFKVAFSEN